MPKRKEIKKSIWLPSVLTLYFLAMAIIFGPDLVRKGETMRLVIVSVVEIVVIIAVYFFYRHRERRNF